MSRWQQVLHADVRNLPPEKRLRLCAFLGLAGAAIILAERGIRHGWTDPMVALAILGIPLLLVGIFASQIIRGWRRHMYNVYGDDGPPVRKWRNW